MDALDDRFAFRAKREERKTEHHREEQHGQHIPFGERADGAGRHETDEELAVAQWLRLLLDVHDSAILEGLRVDVHAGAGRPHVHDEESQHQRNRRDELEVNQRFDCDATDPFGLADARDPMHDGAEDDRRHDHSHQADE
jgi:hypothetical protein